MRHAAIVLPITLFTLALVPAPAGAGGLGVPMDGAGPVSVAAQGHGDAFRYASVEAGANTHLMAIDANGGDVTAVGTIDGRFTVPSVAYRTTAGPSADGRTLVLTDRRIGFPRKERRFIVVKIRPNGAMRPGRPFTLQGDFTFAALSPNGETMYLVEHPSRDYTELTLRAYDIERRLHVPEPVSTSGEMRGVPISSVTSADGRWTYTVYGGGWSNARPFIQALDTVEAEAISITTPQLTRRNVYGVRLGLAGNGTLRLSRGDKPLASVDTETFEVSEPPAPSAATRTEGGGPGALEIAGLGAGVALVIGGGIVALRRRRRPALPPDPFGPCEPEGGDESRAAPERERVDA